MIKINCPPSGLWQRPHQWSGQLELVKEDKRTITAVEIEKRWRQQLGVIHGAEVLSFRMDDGPQFGPNIAFDLMHSNIETLRLASEELEEQLGHYAGIK